MDTPDSNDALSRTLAAWRVAAPRNPEFRTRVWERISAGVGPLPWRAYVRQHAAAVGGALALAVVLGAISGHGQARARAAADSARLATEYVQTYDARAIQVTR